MEPGPLTQCRA